MRVIYIRDSKSRGYLRIGLSDGEKKSEYTVSESEYKELGSFMAGDEVSDIEALELCDMRYRGTLYALRILSFGDNNIPTLRRKLIAKSISASVAEEICEQMAGLGYINEERQLEKLIEREANVTLCGRKKIFAKLLTKGYRKEKIERVLSLLISQGRVDFKESEKKLIEKKFPDGASEEEIRALLYMNGYESRAFSGDLY